MKKIYRYRTRKIKIFIEVLEETILTQISNKYGLLMFSISENQEEFEKDIQDLIELSPNKSIRKWVRTLTYKELTDGRNQ